MIIFQQKQLLVVKKYTFIRVCYNVNQLILSQIWNCENVTLYITFRYTFLSTIQTISVHYKLSNDSLLQISFYCNNVIQSKNDTCKMQKTESLCLKRKTKCQKDTESTVVDYPGMQRMLSRPAKNSQALMKPLLGNDVGGSCDRLLLLNDMLGSHGNWLSNVVIGQKILCTKIKISHFQLTADNKYTLIFQSFVTDKQQ